jgi:presenilin-like A22 family membrane protease
MGLGDAIIPTLLVVSANRFLTQTVIVADFVAVPALTTMVGTFIGFAVLMYFVSSGKPQAGLPFLNTGAILGFVAGVLLTGTEIVWGF